ncbi:Protein kinase domain [Trypanosoma vivax]|uniref:cyclin-dependent kinase n=1 Tax=Trypanosoma vivax (strain Y486) TaxID=1055687 RepID=G0TZI4_TRYVY|nr:putative CDC2-related protein kinase [Trypanosoma vivax]KAH8617025.1 Protein kinase domain [Trypanosoma vivax]CCC49389.1 putative CDC2-related protein kinase [Trypanosoma vivax Y486]
MCDAALAKSPHNASQTHFSAPINQSGTASAQERYTRLEKVGEGSYGVVYRCLDNETGHIVAIKRIPLMLKEGGVPATAVREVSLLRELNHPNVVRLLNVTMQDSKLLLIFEYMEQDLHGMLKHRQTPFMGGKLRRIMFQLLLGLHACHSRRFVHRDIKPSNILIDRRESVVKLADFGLGRAFRVPLQTYTTEVMTLWYRAPEVLLGDKRYLPAVDIWSMGCVFAELARCESLFTGDTAINQLFSIFQLLGTPTEKTWQGVSALPHHNVEFPKWTAKPLSTVVPTLDEDGVDLLQRMLVYNPRERITAFEALQHRWFDDIRGEEMAKVPTLIENERVIPRR